MSNPPRVISTTYKPLYQDSNILTKHIKLYHHYYLDHKGNYYFFKVLELVITTTCEPLSFDLNLLSKHIKLYIKLVYYLYE